MRAGRLRHRIIIQQDTPSQNAHGELISSWGTFLTVWASVEPLRATERALAAGAQQEAEATHRITIRHLDGVSAKMRVSWDSRIFNIESVLADPTNARHIELRCTEVLS